MCSATEQHQEEKEQVLKDKLHALGSIFKVGKGNLEGQMLWFELLPVLFVTGLYVLRMDKN